MKILRTIAGVILGIVLTIVYFAFMKQVIGMPGTMSQLFLTTVLASSLIGTAGWHWPLVRKLM